MPKEKMNFRMDPPVGGIKISPPSGDKIKFRVDRSVLFLNIRIVLSAAIFVAVSAVMIFDVLHIGEFIAWRTQKFAQDLTFQHASNISREFTTRMLSVSLIADSLAQDAASLPPGALEEFLAHKADLSVFDELHFVEAADIPRDGAAAGFHIPNHDVLLPQAGPLHSAGGAPPASIAYDGVGSIYYTQQVVRSGGVLGVLIGVRSRNSLQDLVQMKVLDSQTVSCIVDSGSQVVVAPTNRHLPAPLNLDDFLMFQDTPETSSALGEFRQGVAELRPETGAVRSQNSGERILMSYVPLGINDWGLATFIPERLLAVDSQSYVLRTFLVSLAAICMFAVIAVTAFVSYRRNKRQMELIAFHDRVTDGLNNEGFQLRFQEIVRKARPNSYAVGLMNMRSFKLINEQYGKEEGDKTLRYIHRCIDGSLRGSEFSARISADRFFVCLHEHRPEAIEERLRSVCARINAFNAGRESAYPLEFHCGVRVVEEPGHEVIHIQDHARHAYDLAVQENRFCVFYRKSFTERLLKDQEMDLLFEPSLHNGDFKLHLQPKVDLATGVVCGAEALVRWIHPEKGVIFPSDFIPLFERNGKICRLDVHMFEEVCKVLRRWQDEGRPLIPVSVNLSRQHYFRNPEFLVDFARIARDHRIPAGLLDFELTESIFFDSDKFTAVKRSLEEMHELGFLCSLDDFGVGFSSLGLLKEFDIDTIKFDRQFFLDVSTQKSRTILGSLMEMSEKLGIKTVAEGIETREQLSYLGQTSCDMIQGYIYSRPLSVQEFERWMDALEDRRPVASPK